MIDPIPTTAPAVGWHFTAGDWDHLLLPLESGDMAGIDKAVEGAIMGRIRRRNSPSRIRSRLAARGSMQPTC